MMLRELQRDFRQWLVSASPLLGAHEAGLAVYQNNYRAQLVGCLQASYPLLRLRMGEQAFLHAAVRHVDAFPPHDWTLDAYANHFGSTLESLFPENPDLHELAWIELAMGSAFVAADAAALTPAALATFDWDRARLALVPSLRIAPVRTNAAEVWRALGEAGGAEAPEAAMLALPESLLVWRTGFTCRLRSADALEAQALLTLGELGSLDTVCSLLAGQLGEDAGIARAGSLLADWIGAGLLTAAGTASAGAAA